MRNLPTDLIKSFFRDRLMIGLSGTLLLVGVAYSIFVGLALEPSDLQVAVRYTAFGDTHFYRDKWYYLLSFIAFAVSVIVLHMAIAIKLYGRERPQLSAAVLIFTTLLLIIGWIIAKSVLGIAFL